MQGRVPVTRSLLLKCIIYNLCTYIDCLQESGNGMSLSCSKLLKMQPKWHQFSVKSSFGVMFKDNFWSNGTSGQNTEYHLLFAWTSSTSHTKQNVSILSTHDDNKCHVTIPLFDLISQYMSFSYVTRPLPVKWHFQSKRHISSFVDMTFPYTYKETERFYLVDKRRKKGFKWHYP
jgi:hypothetical protein